jgi:5-methylcytosine-specific restriction protein A
MPEEQELRADLHELLRAYRTLTFRGGLYPSPDENEDQDPTAPQSLVEARRYRLHRRIERNRKAATLAKAAHGTSCQVCGFNFPTVYGDLGTGFIEAHHLRPLSELQEGAPIRYDIAEDFAVLCSNCHRMIHKWHDPADVAGLKSVVTERRLPD